MAGQSQAPNIDLFDAYFRRADLDQDGKISGAEAVAFFQGSNLPNHVLAQIWMHADQNRTSFLGRAEFYNALKLVTVAQSKRELTPDIVKAALFGPAAAKIPPPQINLAATAAPQLSSATSPQMAAPSPSPSPTASQNRGFQGPALQPNTGMNQPNFPSQNNQFVRPSQPMASAGSLPSQIGHGQGFPVRSTMGAPTLPNSNASTDWRVERTTATPQVQNRGVTPSLTLDGFGLGSSGPTSSVSPRPHASSGLTHSVAPRPQNQVSPSFQPAQKDSKASAVSGNGFVSDSIFGDDMFSAISTQPKQDASSPAFSASSVPVSSALVPVSTGTQISAKQSPLDSLQRPFSMQTSGGQHQQTQSLAPQNQPIQTHNTFMSSGITAGPGSSASNHSHISWPRMTQSDIQKYTKVFVEVDTDRDGWITGEQARNLFLSWKLPREVLKQVWDLSDQDNDSRLSLREFCTALYLMERYREGRPLPAVLPSGIFDETLLPTAGQPANAYRAASWTTPGIEQQQGMPGSRPIMPPAGGRMQMQGPVHQQFGAVQPNQQKSRVPVLEKHLVNQLSKEEQNSLNSKFGDATEADKKVEELEKEILDSKEKIEYFRTKMQELVLYKSRCDNRLNEITERASADKREVESLAKKYEEKYKQVGDLASKLTIEEATFRDIQERKMELHSAIVKIEQGGSADGILQVRADRIQSDLEELVKALNDRCKKYGLHVKPTALVELPFGWQSGIQEGAADWDEDWDKFEDEGFTFVKELTLDVQNIIAPPREKFKYERKEKASSNEDLAAASSPPNADSKTEEHSNIDEHVQQAESSYIHSEDDSARSPPGSPMGRSTLESPSQEFGETGFGKSYEADVSPRAKESYSDHGGAESIISGDKSFDEPSWATYDDTDSVWGFNSINTKEPEHDGNKNSFFGSSELGLNPIRTDSPQASNLFGKRSPFSFGDSVPGTPVFNSSNSPPRYSEGGSGDHQFDNISRFDSFRMHDTGGFPPQETLARFDSIRSTRDSDHDRAFSSFDEGDPFSSSGLFKTSSESQTPRKGSEHWSAF